MKTRADEKAERLAYLENRIEQIHLMQDDGRFSQWDGCGTSGREVCKICGLVHEYWRGGQRLPNADLYRDAKGNYVSLAQAAREKCE
jgi:hypothetical protein